MPIVKVDNYVETYRLRSHASELHTLAARDGRENVTDFVNGRILERIDPQPTEILVDVGCGDGCLLRKAAHVATRIGTVGTKDERERLEKAMPGITFEVGLAHALPLKTASADKIVCNGVVMYLGSENQVALALHEISRIAKPNALIWIGELPATDEYAQYKMYLGSSVFGLLWHCLSKLGIRTFLGMCRKLLKAAFGGEQVVLNSASLYYSTPDHFINLAKNCGLKLESYSKHRELDRQGLEIESPYRYNYIFRK
jgi:SAM-dependent methyltransferase